MKTLTLLIILMSGSLFGQITYEATYPNGGNGTKNLHLVKLSASGHKWVMNDTSTLTIYNLNHSVYRTISIPYTGPYNTSGGVVLYNVSEELFNLNPNDIEYMVRVFDANFREHVYVYDELGNVLFARDSVQPGGFQVYTQEFIVHTSQGSKMILSKTSTREAFVYGLPGTLPCDDCNNGVVNIQPAPLGGGDQHQLPYPNPANSQTTLPYSLPANVNSGELIVYDIAGREVKRFSVTNAFSSVILSTDELSAGTYTYSVITSAGISPGSRFIIAE